jgi:hypothetical protein
MVSISPQAARKRTKKTAGQKANFGLWAHISIFRIPYFDGKIHHLLRGNVNWQFVALRRSGKAARMVKAANSGLRITGHRHIIGL